MYRIYSESDGKPLEGFEHRNDMIEHVFSGWLTVVLRKD